MTRSGDRRDRSSTFRTGSADDDAEVDIPHVRLNRYIARSGVCSRRRADELILAGQVVVNGKLVVELGTKVSETDEIRVNGVLVSPTKHMHILLNKPRGVITTVRDDRGRQTVLDLVAIPEKENLGIFPVGRLDRDTTGLLLLTNDGELANRLMHPRYEVEKLYVVHVNRPMQQSDLDRLRAGVDLDGETVRVDLAGFRDPSDLSVIGISLHEGRNRQIRRMIEAIGFSVVKLDRVRYAGLTTSGLRRGRWRRLEGHEIKRLYRVVQLKTK